MSSSAWHATATFVVRSLSDQMSVTVTDASSGALLGDAILPLDQLVMLSETRIEVPLTPAAHQPDWSDAKPADDASDASPDLLAPALVLTLLPLTFGSEKAKR
jgi:hypothetical protein